MSAAVMTPGIAETSPRFKARLAGFVYLLTFVTGGVALFDRSKTGVAAGFVAGACYIAVTLLLYGLFKPVSRRLSLLMVFAGLGWLTFLSPPLAKQLSPYVFAPGILGEGALTLWLLVKGVDVPRWSEQAQRHRAT